MASGADSRITSGVGRGSETVVAQTCHVLAILPRSRGWTGPDNQIVMGRRTFAVLAFHPPSTAEANCLALRSATTLPAIGARD